MSWSELKSGLGRVGGSGNVACALLIAVLALSAMPATARKGETDERTTRARRSILHRVVLYVPNRALDVLDMVRLRARVGPGLAVGVRMTTAVDAYVGAYVSVFAGLPGPRMRKFPKLPLGLESLNGAALSFLDLTASGGLDPDYSPTEIGGGAQLLLVGAEAGLDPVEVLDFAAGLVLIDLRKDDL